jgi:hypothetical protein
LAPTLTPIASTSIPKMSVSIYFYTSRGSTRPESPTLKA